MYKKSVTFHFFLTITFPSIATEENCRPVYTAVFSYLCCHLSIASSNYAGNWLRKLAICNTQKKLPSRFFNSTNLKMGHPLVCFEWHF